MGNRFATEPVVVLGFGTAAMSAIVEMRAAGFVGSIVVITDDDPMPYSPVLTSYYAGGRIGRNACFAWADLDPANLIDELVANAIIASLDITSHEVELADGRRYPYAKLLIATGAHPVSPGFPKVEGYTPLVLRTMHDADRLRDALIAENCRSVLISGTSMVGLKVLEACLDRGVSATLLGRSPHILRESAHEFAAGRFEALLEERGVTLRLTQAVEHAAASGTHGCCIAFGNGEQECFDEVVLAQGVVPNLDFTIPGALEIDRGVIVDQHMRTSDPDVFAAGDVAQALDLLSGEKRIIGLWQNAVQQGRCAGRAIADELAGRVPTRVFPGFIPSNVIHVRDILFASAGTLAEKPGRSIEVEESQGAIRILAHERRNGEKQLIGFNVLSVVSSESQLNGLEREIGTFRREVFNSFL